MNIWPALAGPYLYQDTIKKGRDEIASVAKGLITGVHINY